MSVVSTIGALAVLSALVPCGGLQAQVTERGWLELGGNRIFHEVAGRGATVVLLHDGLTHAGIGAGRLLAGHLHDIEAADPLALASAAAVLAATDLLATWIPARRALALDPAEVLQEE